MTRHYKVRTYGTQRACTATTAASTIFGGRDSPARAPAPETSSVADIESAIENLSLGGASVVNDVDGSQDDSDSSISDTEAEENDEEPELRHLLRAYRTDRGSHLPTSSWSTIIPFLSQVEKIAEASYAEVYRIITTQGSSIIKIMQLRLSSDPDSNDIETSIDINTVVSEFRIMNALTEVPGFVTFKEAHLVRGKLHPEIGKAHRKHLPKLKEGTWFPDPDSYTDQSTFLVIELGDAGTVLEDLKITHLDYVWDIFLGTAIALCRAEMSNEFEASDFAQAYLRC